MNKKNKLRRGWDPNKLREKKPSFFFFFVFPPFWKTDWPKWGGKRSTAIFAESLKIFENKKKKVEKKILLFFPIQTPELESISPLGKGNNKSKKFFFINYQLGYNSIN